MKRRSLVFASPYRAEIREETIPALLPEQVLVETLVSAISSGTEMLVYRGQFPESVVVDETINALAGRFQYPLKYGYSAVGRVVALGSDVGPEWDGRLVLAFHSHESHFAASMNELILVPEDMSAETATLLPNMETAVSFLHDGQPLLGEQVAIFGQGIVGLLTTYLLSRFPLRRLVTLDRFANRRHASTLAGAHTSLDPNADNIAEQLHTQLYEGSYQGTDLTYELSGAPSALDQAIAVTGFHGRIVVGSWYGQKRASLDLGGSFHRSRIQLISSQVSTIAPELSGRWSKNRRITAAWDMLRATEVSPLITHRYPIEEAPAAYSLLDQSPEQAIQILLTYNAK